MEPQFDGAMPLFVPGPKFVNFVAPVVLTITLGPLEAENPFSPATLRLVPCSEALNKMSEVSASAERRP